MSWKVIEFLPTTILGALSIHAFMYTIKRFFLYQVSTGLQLLDSHTYSPHGEPALIMGK